MQRYKESLGLTGGQSASDPNDPRVCIILSLTMDSEGRPATTIDLSEKGAEVQFFYDFQLTFTHSLAKLTIIRKP